MTSVSLDDETALAALDRGGMLRLVASLPDQLREGFDAAAATSALPAADGIRAIVVCGMGGSGIAGDVVAAYAAPRLAVPVLVLKGYDLPSFCDADTLVVASSYSGNTEETIAAYGQAVARGCRVVAVSAGGELAARAEADDVPWLGVPHSIGLPRAALGHLAAAPLGVLAAIGLAPDLADDLTRAVDATAALRERVGAHVPEADNESKTLARWLAGALPVVWGSTGVAAAAALRWRSQLNENAKTPAFASVLPELDHNEVEGWAERSGERFRVVIIRHGDEHSRTGDRVAATTAALGTSGLAFREAHARAGGDLAALFELVMLGDFTSVYLAAVRGVDPSPIPVLTSIKERLRP